ncbi:indole-3-glycerol phosphate synthase TrpC [Desulfosporosinus sp. BICA1-9]|uniref:indole-3-glycerol phosphate synthase TrpC n=1 Tax=Desulfosporosinus sp. BICA1-9 TaxID=1531958 RepID=UPI00054C1DCD|nr:indole-3-glycerol phosphate synthase TrpC [Desulfosporosinus sp. BICA1-9]KJS47053.1 MAG: indole-3-glycerol phosphate synthase [Peptococcaceae bacterium BRH_c23]KJS88643.1 MAG: indole-3-glycerol phosphate synthase [Desulfosporosinus sp. BICA1-9]HBW36171.1 indole-3-glycerol phosphate synthase TrpC [Desulfosporosinus sp.]
MILEKIATRTVERVAEMKQRTPLEHVIREAKALTPNNGLDINTVFPFEKALRAEGLSFICELKKASPSQGIIAQDFPYLQIAKDYEAAGAAAISVLTEPYWFHGHDQYLTEIHQQVGLPLLRKDFIVDGYQIYESKILGASAILLICALLNTETLKDYLDIAHGLGLSALVEAHTEEEVRSALAAGARVIGVNNRNLKTFEVDITTSIRLRALVPEDILFISESGIKSPEDVARLKANKTDAVLIGESLMRSENKKEQLAILRGEREIVSEHGTMRGDCV